MVQCRSSSWCCDEQAGLFRGEVHRPARGCGERDCEFLLARVNAGEGQAYGGKVAGEPGFGHGEFGRAEVAKFLFLRRGLGAEAGVAEEGVHNLVGGREVLPFLRLAGVDGDLISAVAGDEQARAADVGMDRPAVIVAYSLAGAQDAQWRRPGLGRAFREQLAA